MFPVLAGNNPTGYNLTRSLRLRASASAYLSRTPASASNRTTWTWSGWVKRGQLGSAQFLMSAGTTTPIAVFGFLADDTFFFNFEYTSNAFITTQVFRDPSAWYHIVVVADTTNATASNRTRLYVNGSQVTSFSSTSYPAQNNQGYININQIHTIARRSDTATNYLDGYLAEINFIDGQALTPSSFGSYNSTTGVWQPAKYTGTYGTNGFYLPFTDNSALTTSSNVGLGKDFSGNGNYWTTNNISITAGVTYDSMTDVPTLTSATASNYPVINPLDYASTNGSISNGNLTYTTNTNSSNNYQRTSMAFPSKGKWYVEFTATQVNIGSGVGYGLIGIAPLASYLWWTYSSPFYQISNGSSYATIPTINSGDVIQIAIDNDNGKAWFGQNGTWLLSGNPATGTPMSTAISFTAGLSNIRLYIDGRTGSATNIINANFGQRPFTYTPPSGFVALNAYNLPDSTIKQGNKVMDATLYTGNGSTQTITNAAGFKPDLVWGKNRSAGSTSNWLENSVTGAGQVLYSDQTSSEQNNSTYLPSINSNGFTVAGNTSYFNASGNNYVAWQWQAGQGTTSSNTNGTITSTTSVNASAGFSTVTYTGTGTNATIGHGLGIAPVFMIVKERSLTRSWRVYHSSLASGNVLYLDSTSASTSEPTSFNSTAPTSSVFSVGTGVGTNESANTYVAYCFAPIAGYSAFGSYTGNGSADGTFVYLGFKPRFVLLKRTDSAGNNWFIWDTARDTYNVVQNYLWPNSSTAEGQDVAIDILSNGFKARSSSANYNASGGTYVYAAFSSNPFKNSLAQ